MEGKSGIYMLIGVMLMFVAVVMAVGGFVGGTIGVMFIVGLVTFIVGVVKWRSPAG